MVKLLIIFVLASGFVAKSVFAETYVCSPETAAGLVFLGGKWQVLPYGQEFASTQKYVIRTDESGSSAAIYDQETDAKLFDCKYWFPNFPTGTCGDGANSIFKFVGDRKTRSGKYAASGIGSDYLLGGGALGATKNFSTIEQGKCLRID